MRDDFNAQGYERWPLQAVSGLIGIADLLCTPTYSTFEVFVDPNSASLLLLSRARKLLQIFANGTKTQLLFNVLNRGEQVGNLESGATLMTTFAIINSFVENFTETHPVRIAMHIARFW